MSFPQAYRNDCSVRLTSILNRMDSIRGKSLIDIGCSNGYFMYGFLRAGGKSALGIEPNYDDRTLAKSFDLEVDEFLIESDRKFDYCFYLDLHFHSQNYLPYISEHCKVAFISPSGDGERNNIRLAEEAMKFFKNVCCVYKTDYSNRMIFKCE